MKAFGTFLGTVLGLALLAALLAGGYFLFKYVVSVYATLEPQVRTIAAIASVIAVLCAAIIASGLKSCNQNSISAQRVAVYQQLLALWSEQVKGSFEKESGATDREFIRLEQLLALHGNQKVVATHMNLRKSVRLEGKGGEMQGLLKKLLVEMRADIGRTEFNIKKNDLLALLLERN